MSNLIKSILSCVLRINGYTNVKAHFRYIDSGVAVDVVEDGKNIYHDTTDNYADMNDGLNSMLTELNVYMEDGKFRPRSFYVVYSDEYLNVRKKCDNLGSAETVRLAIDEMYNIKSWVEESYI